MAGFIASTLFVLAVIWIFSEVAIKKQKKRDNN